MFDERSHHYLILFALWLMVFSSSSQVIIVAPLLPVISQVLDVPEAVQGTLVSAYSLTLSLSALIAGPISDRIGRRFVLLIGTGAMTIALVLHGLVDSYIGFIGVRAAAGVCGGMLSGAAVAYVGDFFPYEKRGWANGWVMSGIAFGQVLGVPAGVYLAERVGFRPPFLFFAGTMALAFILILRIVPQPSVERASQPLRPGRIAQRYFHLLRRTEIAGATMVYFLMFLSVALYVVYLPTWLKEVHNVTGDMIASLFLVGGLASVLVGPWAGNLSDRLGRKPVIIFACLGLAVLMAGTPFVVHRVWLAYPLFFLVMILITMRMSPLQALLTALVKDTRRGMLLSMAVAVGQFGIGVGGMIAGPAYAQLGYGSNAAMATISIVFMALLVWRLLPEPEPHPSSLMR